MSAQTAAYAQPIPEIDLAHPELPGSAAIGALIGASRVVALGEGAHSIVEFTAYGDAFLRTLVRDHGVTAFVMESGFAEGLLVDEWIRGGPGAVQDIAREGITYRFGESESLWRQLEWMREWNAAGGGIRFYGMDLPGSSTSPGPAVRACLARIPARDGDEELQRLADLGGRTEAAIAYASMSDGQRTEFAESLRALIARVREDGDEIALRCAASIDAYLAELDGDDDAGPYPRETFMAETVEWIAAREERILVYAHNGHVRRTPLDGRPMMGALLSSALGADLRVIGMTYGAGPVVTFTQRSPRPFDCDVSLGQRGTAPGSIEERLDAIGADAVLVDLSRADAALLDGVEGMLASGSLERVDDFPASFDALLHLHRVRPTPGAFERLRAEFDAPGWSEA